MPEFAPITTLADLDLQNQDEIIAGYRAGYRGDPEPGSDRSRGFVHGYRNGCVDAGRELISAAQSSLAHAFVQQRRAN